jgi:hypothetical protein
MINTDFCEFLEYEICKAFEYTDIQEIKGFWCDGIILNQQENYYSKKFVNDNKSIQLKAFIGKDGQKEFELTLVFGNKSLSRYARGLDIKECLPRPDQHDFFDIDITHNKIKIQLD